MCVSRGKDSSGDNLIHYSDGSAHCFACGYHEHGPFTPFKTKEIPNDSKVLPADFSREVPTKAWKWLLQYGLPYSYWKERVGYSEKEGRLYILMGDSKSPTFSQGRLIDEDRGGKKWFTRGRCHDSVECVSVAVSSPVSVLVEDIVSCHKVGQVAECVCLFGTTIHPAHTYFLRDGSQRPIVLWLDEDQKGLVSKTVAKLQLLTNRPVTTIFTKDDPKSCTLETIKELLL